MDHKDPKGGHTMVSSDINDNRVGVCARCGNPGPRTFENFRA